MALVHVIATDGGGSAKNTYKVTASYVWAYNKMDKSSSYKSSAYMASGCIFTGIETTDSSGETWVKVSAVQSGTSSGSPSGKYIPFTSTSGETNITKTSSTSVSSTVSTLDTAEAEDLTEGSTIINYTDDQFTVEYGSSLDSSTEAYYSSLSDGLSIEDMRGVMGMPHQYTTICDPRIDSSTDDSALGRNYSLRIVKRIPLLLMTPGTPSFMSSFNSSQKKTVLATLMGNLTDNDLNTLLDGESGKYYSLKYAYTDYFRYVNAMLRSAAYFLGIENETINGTKLSSLNWMYNAYDDSDIFGHAGLSKFLGPYAGCVAFYVDPGYTVDDSFSNSTTQSSLASSLNSLSDQGRELNFLVGSVGSLSNLALTDEDGNNVFNSILETGTNQIEGLLGKGNILSNILSKANTILAGGRLVFPEIWSDSSFGRSYSCSMKLVAGSGAKLSVFLDILVPIYHLLGFALPRQSEGQAYYSPFLIRAYCQGAFNVDMGIMTSLSITKGAEGEWTIDGLPTVANVSFDIKDLYEGFFMSKQESLGDTSLFTNITELDYIANTCGVNVNDQEVLRTIKMYMGLGFGNYLSDTLEIGIFGNIAQFFNQKMVDIFGVF